MGNVCVGLSSLCEQCRQVFGGIVEGDVRSAKSHGLPGVLLQKLPDAPAKHSPDQDIGVEDNHLSESRLSCPLAVA